MTPIYDTLVLEWTPSNIFGAGVCELWYVLNQRERNYQKSK